MMAIVLLVGVYGANGRIDAAGVSITRFGARSLGVGAEHEQLSVELAEKKSLSTVSERMKILGLCRPMTHCI